MTAHDGLLSVSATVSQAASVTVNAVAATPEFTASATTINEDGTSEVMISITNLAELTEDGTDTVTVKISGLPNLSQNGHALTASRRRQLHADRAFGDGGGRSGRPDHHACGLVREQHSVQCRGHRA